jgi:tetratricopeptide (TPR) repeat protein
MLRYFRERKRKKKDAEELVRRGVVFEFEEEDLEKAKELYEKALELYPKSISASHRLMRVESALRVKAAFSSKVGGPIFKEEPSRSPPHVPEEKQSAIEISDSMTAKEIFFLGLDCEQEEDYDKAKEAYEKVLALEPDHVGAKNGLKRVARALEVSNWRDAITSDRVGADFFSEQLIRGLKLADKIVKRPLSLTPDELRSAREFTDWLETAYLAAHLVSRGMDYPKKKEEKFQPGRRMICPSCDASFSYNPEKIASDGTTICQNCGKVIRIS